MKSKKNTLNKADWRKQLVSAGIWLAPLAVFYLAQLQGSLVDKKVLGWAELIPNEMTTVAMQYYAVSQAYGILRRFMEGK